MTRHALFPVLFFASLVACSAPMRDEDSTSETALGGGPNNGGGGGGNGNACTLAPAITPKWEAGRAGRPNGPMLFDAARNRLVVFTANGTSALGASGWSVPSGDPLPPGPRDLTAIAYDAERGRAVLFGGGDHNTLLGDTWEWDGAANTWTEMTPAGFTPRARRGHALAYDAARKRTVLFGGLAGNQSVDKMEDTWTWDGSAWARVGTTAQPHPESRFGPQMVFDANRGRVVLYGQFAGWYLGQVGGGNTSEGNTWEWDGSSWTRAQNGDGTFSSDDPTSLPMAYDTQRGRVVRIGTEGSRYQKTFTVLEWDGDRWSKTSVGKGPSVDNASMTEYYGTYDPTRSRMVLGNTAYTWKTQEFFFYEEPNRAPALAPVADQRVFAGDALTVALTATDLDGSPIQYDVTPLPAGASMDAQSGTLRWTPTATQAGTYALTAKASDGCAGSTRTFTVRVDNLSYAGLASGTVKLGGTLSLPVYLYQPSHTYQGQAQLSCVVAGQNPGKVAVTCDGKSSQGWAYGGYTMSFTPTSMTAALEQDLSFAYHEGANDALRTMSGRLEPLSDGTYMLHITAWAQPHVAMRTTPPHGTDDAYGVVDTIP